MKHKKRIYYIGVGAAFVGLLLILALYIGLRPVPQADVVTSPTGVPVKENAVVWGYVRDASNSPLSGVVVYFNNQAFRSDTDGSYVAGVNHGGTYYISVVDQANNIHYQSANAIDSIVYLTIGDNFQKDLSVVVEPTVSPSVSPLPSPSLPTVGGIQLVVSTPNGETITGTNPTHTINYSLTGGVLGQDIRVTFYVQTAPNSQFLRITQCHYLASGVNKSCAWNPAQYVTLSPSTPLIISGLVWVNGRQTTTRVFAPKTLSYVVGGSTSSPTASPKPSVAPSVYTLPSLLPSPILPSPTPPSYRRYSAICYLLPWLSICK